MAHGAIISTNLSNTSAGTETATGTTWLAVSFGTGSSSYTLDSATLLLANTTAGQSQLRVYSDGALAPGTLLGTLNSPASYSATLANTTYTATGITLSAGTTYWLVLSATSGAFDWSWTASNTGDGDGYQNTWSISNDAGTSWFSYDFYPLQVSVSATPVTSAVPEPGSFGLLGLSVACAAPAVRRRIRIERQQKERA